MSSNGDEASTPARVWSDRAAILALALALVGVPMAWWYCWKIAVAASYGITMIWPFRSDVLDVAKTGQIGDTFGAINALFSGLALIGVAYAVLLQRREVAAAQEQLSIAKESAKGDEAARRMSEQMQADQARTLLISARLGAVQTITQATGEIARLESTPQEALPHDAWEMKRDLELANQYTRIILNDIDQSIYDWKDVPKSARTIYRKYLVVFLRQSAARVVQSMPHPSFIYEWDLGQKLYHEIELLRMQPGVVGMDDGRYVEMVHEELKTLKTKIGEQYAQWSRDNPGPEAPSGPKISDPQQKQAESERYARLKKEHEERYKAHVDDRHRGVYELLVDLASRVSSD